MFVLHQRRQIGNWHIVEYRRRTGVIVPYVWSAVQWYPRYRQWILMDPGRIFAERCSKLENWRSADQRSRVTVIDHSSRTETSWKSCLPLRSDCIRQTGVLSDLQYQTQHSGLVTQVERPDHCQQCARDHCEQTEWQLQWSETEDRRTVGLEEDVNWKCACWNAKQRLVNDFW